MGISEPPPIATAPPPRHGFGRRGLVLGMVTLSSPLAMNMYVPAVPRIAADLGTDPAAIQYSLTSFLIALAFGQNVYGPLSDRFGRRRPLFVGLALFLVASIAVAFATTLEWLVAFRFLQGFGACAAMAIPRAVVRDLHTGAEAARLLAMMVLVVSIAPLLAPLAGSGLASAFSWRTIFWFMAGTSLLAILLVALFLKETLPPGRRSTGGIRAVFRDYRILLGDPHFTGLMLMMALAQAAFFAFLGASPVLFMDLYGWEDWEFGLMFGATATFWAISAQLSPIGITRFGAKRVLTTAAAINLATYAVLLAAGLLGQVGPVAIIIAMLLAYLATGIMLPTATVTALHLHGRMAGTASALIGSAGFGLGAASAGLVSALDDGTVMPMLAVMAGCALLSAGAARLAFSGDHHLDEAGPGRGE
ncbi:MAG TPA: multidrug effflux MFS transporter [Allosphingosinicella sp.]|nr:multidrug effflux MFS transporter [Allosphingosinicella sp.]